MILIYSPLGTEFSQKLRQSILVHLSLRDGNHRVVEPLLRVEDSDAVHIKEDERGDQPGSLVAVQKS